MEPDNRTSQRILVATGRQRIFPLLMSVNQFRTREVAMIFLRARFTPQQLLIKRA